MEEVTNKVSELTIVDLLEKSAVANEANIALIFNNERLTYKELNSQSNKIANYLIQRGVKPETLVPIALDSGITLITGIIGILKAGGAYVPINPEYPDFRINYMLEDCASPFIVTTTSHGSKLKTLYNAEIIELDSGLLSSGNCSEKNPVTGLRPENLAYTMYTSGTTGMPNGVMIEHRSVVNNLTWARNYFNIDLNDVVLQKTNFCFDVSVWEIFWPLITGSKLVIMGKDDYKDIAMLKSVIELNKVSTTHFVPTMLELFLLNLTPGECISLKRIVSSGEALTPFQINLVKNKLPGVELHNLYGPTETTIHSSYWMVPDDVDKVEKVLIGKPIDDTEIFILNGKNENQPMGVDGDIYIGGIGVARGYLNNPDLTKARFIINPLSNNTNSRLFKTGDLGRYLGDGNIEYLGRIDDQVKINGYRVELESVEANIISSGIVKQAVVLAGKNALGTMQIIAYVVLKPTAGVRDLWDYLVTVLPAYMLPASIKEVDKIPFNSNGKVDKKLLIENGLNRYKNLDTSVPLTALQGKIMAIWNNVFQNDSITIYDNFFEIGGNSIMAVQMLALLKKETGKHVSFLLLYQFPTIESLANLINKPDFFKAPEVLVPIKPAGNKPPVYLVNGGGIANEGFTTLAAVLDKEQPVYGFQSNGYDQRGKLLNTIEDVAGYYIENITNKNDTGPYCIAGYSLGGIIAFEMARQLKAMGREVKLLAMIDGLTRDPEIIKTKHSAISIIRLIALNIYIAKFGLTTAFKYSGGILRAVVRRLKPGYRKSIEQPQKPIPNTDDHFDVFGLHADAYKKYTIKPYDGNIIIFRAKRKTFYMDDFKYLGWKPFSKKIKSIPIKGHHYSIFDEVNIKGFGEKFQTVLDSGF